MPLTTLLSALFLPLNHAMEQPAISPGLVSEGAEIAVPYEPITPWKMSNQESLSEAPGLERADRSGFYAKIFGGVGLLESDDILFTDGGGGGLIAGDGEFDPGFLGGAAVGYRFNENWSLELEYAYRSNDVDTFESGGANQADGGDFASTSVIVNLLYHFDTDWKFDPYVGFGFGMADEIDIDLEGPGFTGEESFSGDSPAAQYLLGAQAQLMSELDFYIEGRFFRAFDPDMSGEGNPGNVESEYGHFGLNFGLSYSF